MTNIEKKGYHPVTIRIYSKEKELLLEDKVLCAYDTRSNAIVAMGEAGLSYMNDDHVAVVNPMKWGVVGDFTIFSKVMWKYIKDVSPSFSLKPRIAMCVPAKLTEVEKKAFEDAILQNARSPFWLFEKTFEQMLAKEYDKETKGVNYYIELVSEYYGSEYFS